MRDHVDVRYEEGQRQATLLALAKLSIERPGWLDMLEEIALLMDNRVDDKPELFHKFRNIHMAFEGMMPTGALVLALEESVKLQSHYAQLLNVWDGGERMQFPDASAWIVRLIKIGAVAEIRSWP
jgi:hypothetical protein